MTARGLCEWFVRVICDCEWLAIANGSREWFVRVVCDCEWFAIVSGSCEWFASGCSMGSCDICEWFPIECCDLGRDPNTRPTSNVSGRGSGLENCVSGFRVFV